MAPSLRIRGFVALIAAMGLAALGAACTQVDSGAVTDAIVQSGILENVDSVSGKVTVTLQDGTTVELDLADVSVDGVDGSVAAGTLLPGQAVNLSSPGETDSPTTIESGRTVTVGTISAIEPATATITLLPDAGATDGAATSTPVVLAVTDSTTIKGERDSSPASTDPGQSTEFQASGPGGLALLVVGDPVVVAYNAGNLVADVIKVDEDNEPREAVEPAEAAEPQEQPESAEPDEGVETGDGEGIGTPDTANSISSDEKPEDNEDERPGLAGATDEAVPGGSGTSETLSAGPAIADGDGSGGDAAEQDGKEGLESAEVEDAGPTDAASSISKDKDSEENGDDRPGQVGTADETVSGDSSTGGVSTTDPAIAGVDGSGTSRADHDGGDEGPEADEGDEE